MLLFQRSAWAVAGAVPIAALLPSPAWAQASRAAVAIHGADTAWMLIFPVLVILMTRPGIMLFNSGMLRTRNALSIVAHRVAASAVITLTWAELGHSLAFSSGTPWCGGLARTFAAGLIGKSAGAHGGADAPRVRA